jgi:flagellar protein FliO/FliZ
MKSQTLIRGAAIAGALTLSHATVALAAGAGESTRLHLSAPVGSARHAAGGGGIGSSLVRTIVGLFIVIAVIYGISWLLRQRKGAGGRASGSGLATVASLPLGSGRSVALVRVGRELVLLGVAEHGVTAIRSYTEKEALLNGLELPVDEADNADFDASGSPPFARAVDAMRRMTERP